MKRALISLIALGSLVEAGEPERQLLLTTVTPLTLDFVGTTVNQVAVYDDGLTTAASTTEQFGCAEAQVATATPGQLRGLQRALLRASCLDVVGSCGGPLPSGDVGFATVTCHAPGGRVNSFAVGPDMQGCPPEVVELMTDIGVYLDAVLPDF